MRDNKIALIISPSYQNYEDRAYMFSKIIDKMESGSIHFHNRAIYVPKEIIHTSPTSNSPIRKWFYTVRITRKWVKANKGQIVIHDLFAPRGSLASIFDKRPTKVLSLYADNANYYFGKKYKTEIANSSVRNKLYIHFMYIKRIVIEYIGIMIADGVIANSPEIIEGIEKYYKPKNKKIAVINTCVNTDFWKQIDLNREAKTIFFAGRLAKRKGLDVLFQAINHLIKVDNEIKLVVAGAESSEESFKWGYDYVKNNNLENNISFIGHVNRDDIRDWYNKASVFVLPSNQEGSPRVVKEAMACGCPVVCTKIPGTHILDPNNVVLNFFKNNDSVDLSDKIEKVLTKKQDYELISEFAKKNFSPDKISDDIIEFYKRLND